MTPQSPQDGSGGAEGGSAVHPDTPRQIPEAQGGADGVWVAYYGDRSAVVIFAEEIKALRYAVGNSMSVKFIRYGDPDAL